MSASGAVNRISNVIVKKSSDGRIRLNHLLRFVFNRTAIVVCEKLQTLFFNQFFVDIFLRIYGIRSNEMPKTKPNRMILLCI